MTTGLVEWLRSQLDADERIAIAASSDRDGSTPGGEHWHWECSNCDTPIPITPVTLLDEMLECPNCASGSVALRSDEEYETGSVGKLPHFVTRYNEEQRPVDALHIANHAPAYTLRTVAAHRAILDRHSPRDVMSAGLRLPNMECGYCVDGEDAWTSLIHGRWPCPDVRSIASIYEDRPGFDPSWRAEP